ncbi:MAG: hypothetical protein M1363_05345 [Gammaproteobacteria bacterium]|nr:hypothetical protein [Gammaproteobacteria bacterium]
MVLVPIFSGGGSKVKTFEALAYGKAIIASAHGLRGLPEPEKAKCQHAESLADFIAAVNQFAP